MVERKFSASIKGLGETLDFIEAKLLEYKYNRKEINHAILSVEETLVCLINGACEDSFVKVKISKFFGRAIIKIVTKGKKIDLEEVLASNQHVDDSMGPEAEEAIRNIILKTLLKEIKYKYKNGYSTLFISVGEGEKAYILYTLGALAIAIIFGLVGRHIINNDLVGYNLIMGIDNYILLPIRSMFSNAIALITAPIVFFAVANCVADFRSYFEFGKIGTKVIFLYFITTILAVVVGIVSFYILKPGIFNIIPSASATFDTPKFSYVDMIVDIIPTSIFQPFMTDSVLQLLFFSVMIGIALSMVGEYNKILRELFDAFLSIFVALRTLIVVLFPLAIFCSIAHLLLTVGSNIFYSIMQMLFTVIFATALMICIYCFIIFFVGKLNPIIFIKKYASNFIPTLTAASHFITMPDIFNTCGNKLGISKKVYSFSIPIGATINMDGNCIFLSIASLFLARISGINLSFSQMMILIVSVIILSFGAPGQAGSGVVCLMAILTQVGVPLETITFIVSIDALVGMFRKMSNICGDVACSLTVAATEKLVDKEKYNS